MMIVIRPIIALLLTACSASAFVAPVPTTPTSGRFDVATSSPDGAMGSINSGAARNAALVVVALTLTLATITPPNANAADVIEGKKLFEANCAACHAGGQNTIVKDKDLQKDTLQKNFGMDAAAIKAYVKDGNVHKGALMFGGTMKSSGDFDDVVAYVLDQASQSNW